MDVAHPDYPGIGITVAQLSGPTDNPDADWRNTVTMANGAVSFEDNSTWTGALDRCPCGTGTRAKMAVLNAKSELELGRPFRHEGILGTVFTGELVKEVEIAGRWGVVPTIGGQAWIYGFSTYLLDPTDPFAYGFTIGDLWG